MRRTLARTSLLAVPSLMLVFAAPSGTAAQIHGIDPAAAIGIQLAQPAATAPPVGAVLAAVIVANDRFNSFGFVGAQVGDKVSVWSCPAFVDG